jgi:hypothetical protein
MATDRNFELKPKRAVVDEIFGAKHTAFSPRVNATKGNNGLTADVVRKIAINLDLKLAA